MENACLEGNVDTSSMEGTPQAVFMENGIDIKNTHIENHVTSPPNNLERLDCY